MFCQEFFLSVVCFFFFFQAEDGIRDAQESRGLGDVYKRQDELQGVLFRQRIGRALPGLDVLRDGRQARVTQVLSLIHI